MAVRSVPGAASVVAPADDATSPKLFSPSAARNLAPLADLIAAIAPAARPDRPQPKALEIASGTGQHITGFAARCPHILWQPSEVDPLRRASIDAHVRDHMRDQASPNIAPALHLDATETDWPAGLGRYDLITLCNLLHLISAPEARTLIDGAARHLAPGGRLMIYGPFMRAGELTSEGDRSFHAKLTAHDPDVGYKDDFDVMDWMQAQGLEMAEVVEMPANNLALIAVKPA